MKYLLDSHTYVWLLVASENVGSDAKNVLSASDAEVFVSTASLWELSLKVAKGKLNLTSEQLFEGLEALGVETLSINTDHIKAYGEVRLPHSDPFDTVLCAQAQAEDMKLATADRVLIENYKNSLDVLQ